MATGATPTQMNLTSWYTATLSASGGTIVGTIDGTRVFQSDDKNPYTMGFTSLGTGWHVAHFDNFNMNTSV